MNRFPFLLPIFLVGFFFQAIPAGSGESPPTVATFSIVAVDKATGELGIAVQSKIVGVGAVVPYARAGIGAVATQAYANVDYGPAAMMLLASGMTPFECIKALTEGDPMEGQRQLGIVNAEGAAANFTGVGCMEWAGAKAGKGYTVQGNILAGEDVVRAMAEAFETTEGVLAERLLAALEAGQEAGGDRRGRQSAALLIVREGWGYGGLGDRFRDIRVDEHKTPIKELRRVYEKHCALFPRPSRQ